MTNVANVTQPTMGICARKTARTLVSCMVFAVVDSSGMGLAPTVMRMFTVINANSARLVDMDHIVRMSVPTLV